MARRTWFSLVITKKTLFISAAGLLVIVFVLVGSSLYNQLLRRVHGVKPGVKIAGHDVGGLLRSELYGCLIK